MASNINGIKVYPKYSFKSILSSILCILTALGIIFVTSFLPIAALGLKGATCQINGFDFLCIFLQDNPFGFNVSLPSQIAEFTHIMSPEKFDQYQFHGVYAFCLDHGAESTSILISWFGMKIGALGEIPAGIFVEIVFVVGYAFVTIGSIFLLLKGIFKLILGSYPRGSSGLTNFIFYFMALLVVASFLMMYSTKTIMTELYDKSYCPDVFDYCYSQYIAFGALFAVSLLQKGLYSSVRDKLYVKNSRRIKKNKEIEQ